MVSGFDSINPVKIVIKIICPFKEQKKRNKFYNTIFLLWENKAFCLLKVKVLNNLLKAGCFKNFVHQKLFINMFFKLWLLLKWLKIMVYGIKGRLILLRDAGFSFFPL